MQVNPQWQTALQTLDVLRAISETLIRIEQHMAKNSKSAVGSIGKAPSPKMNDEGNNVQIPTNADKKGGRKSK